MKYDVVIVGGGSAGCTLATRLSEDPNRSVLLLEAGPDYIDLEHLPDELKYGHRQEAADIDSPFNWAYRGQGTTDQEVPMQVVRGKVIGGSGSVNGQVFLRGVPEDYDDWAAEGNYEWSFVNLLPFFRKLETDLNVRDDFHGTDGPIPVWRLPRKDFLPVNEAFHQATVAAGFPEDPDMNNPDSTGTGPVPMNNPGGIRMSASLAYLNPNRHRLNLTIKANVLAHRVLFAYGDPTRAVGVEVESGGEKFTVEGSEIILCAGGIATPQLLLLSGVGPAGHLSDMGIPVVKDLPGVGQNLRDHPLVTIELEPKDGVKLSTTEPRIQSGLRYTAKGSDSRNDMQLFPSSFTGLRAGDPLQGRSPDRPQGLGITCILKLADSAGELTLNSADPSDPPHLEYRYFETEWDRKRMREAIHLSLKFLEHPVFGPLVERRLSPTDADVATDNALDAWLRQNVATTQHTSGTCKMGPESDPMAVVDQYCRVRGLQNLRVVDLSICPNVVRANTNATAIVIAERAAGWIN
ncbi:MAG: mycofactocin system GMC family oxidoreductase MftG [SAR202 cluster bacterium MP-NPac-SRR3961935-G1]|nr:MAG: mycofactocin system GMC family oxidoreductase MftG [SAR202 cluster bacterium MP-NPac-SRR3961935-G1]